MLRNDREKEEIEILGETNIIAIFCYYYILELQISNIIEINMNDEVNVL